MWKPISISIEIGFVIRDFRIHAGVGIRICRFRSILMDSVLGRFRCRRNLRTGPAKIPDQQHQQAGGDHAADNTKAVGPASVSNLFLAIQ